MAVNYDRRALNQSGTGHFSPIGAYELTRDLVLILDVARFKYPPHWVPLNSLLDAMRSIDPATERPRGFIVMEKYSDQASIPVIFTMNSSIENSKIWSKLSKWLRTDKNPLSSELIDFLADFRSNLTEEIASNAVKIMNVSDIFDQFAALSIGQNKVQAAIRLKNLIRARGSTSLNTICTFEYYGHLLFYHLFGSVK